MGCYITLMNNNININFYKGETNMKNIVTIIFAITLITINRLSAVIGHAIGTTQNIVSFGFALAATTIINVFAAVFTIVRWKGFMSLSPAETAKMYVAGTRRRWKFMSGLFKEYQKHTHVGWMRRSEAVSESLLKDNEFADKILSAMM